MTGVSLVRVRVVRLVVVALLASAVAIVGWAGPAAGAEHPPAFITTWGTGGTGNGRFNLPLGVAVDPTSGDVYVVDGGNDRVQKFDSDGTFLTKWGTTGSGNGQFHSPGWVAVAPTTGDVYVTDFGNSRVQKFDSDSIFLTTWGTSGTGNGQFNLPTGVAVDPTTGDVYVVDAGNNRVQKFDSDGTFLATWGTRGSGNGQFRSPEGVAVDPTTGDVYVSDRFNDRVQKFDSNGTFLTKWGTLGSGNGQFNAPFGVAVDPSTGDVYVADAGNNRIQKFDSGGTFLTKWGTGGTGNGQFNAPLGVAVAADGNVYVVDLNNRVQKFGGCGHPFTDVPAWVTDAVNWASCSEYLTGYPDDTFRPNQPMTRAEVARVLYRVAGSPDVSGLPAHGFTDVPAWVEDAVTWMAANDYATGYDDGTFRPDLASTRAQVTRMQYRIAGSPPGSPPHPFTDVPAWVSDAVDWIVDPAHVPPYATGYDDNTYRPDLDITRAETTRMTCRINTTPGTC